MSKHFDMVWINQFKKDYKPAIKCYLDIALLENIIHKLARDEQLPEKNKDLAFPSEESLFLSFILPE